MKTKAGKGIERPITIMIQMIPEEQTLVVHITTVTMMVEMTSTVILVLDKIDETEVLVIRETAIDNARSGAGFETVTVLRMANYRKIIF